MRIQSFQAVRPPHDLASRVASPPYDVIDSDRARDLARGNDASFLHIVRPEIDLPEGTNLYSDEVYAQARTNLARFLEKGYLVRDPAPGLFIYRLRMGGHAQTGVVATCHVEDYDAGLIKKHELTLEAKEIDRTRHIDSLDAHTGPVFLAYRDDAGIDAQIESVQQGTPLADFEADDGVRHTVWFVDASEPFQRAFAAVPAAYVADGHHRVASAARVRNMRREANPGHHGSEPYNWFLAVLFPAGQLQILAYNRAVSDLNGSTTAAFLDLLRDRFDLTENADPTPKEAGTLSMYLDGKWYGLKWQEDPEDDPVDVLDISLLQQRILAPILGITDPRTSDRIAFVGGIHGAGELKRRVDVGESAVAFSLYPTRVDQLMAVSDASRVMPPKSTWFEPKLRSGLFVHCLGS